MPQPLKYVTHGVAISCDSKEEAATIAKIVTEAGYTRTGPSWEMVVNPGYAYDFYNGEFGPLSNYVKKGYRIVSSADFIAANSK